MCLRYPPTIVACVCIHLACKWSKYQIPLSAEGKKWFQYVDQTGKVNLEMLDRLVSEFLGIFDKCPSRLKKKIMASTKATKEEEERRARGDIAAASYTPDFSLARTDPQQQQQGQPRQGSGAPKGTTQLPVQQHPAGGRGGMPPNKQHGRPGEKIKY